MRHRASISSTSIPIPPQSHTTNHISGPPSSNNLLSVDTTNIRPQLSSSAPSIGSFLAESGTPHSPFRDSSETATSPVRREAVINSNSPLLTVEFDGGTHIIIRPNRVLRGNYDIFNLEEENFDAVK